MATRELRSRKAAPTAGTAVDLDPSVEWSAKVVQPNRTVVGKGSVQPLIVSVSSPEVLDSQPVRVTVAGVTAAAEWIGRPGRHRECMTMLGGSLPVPSGHQPVKVQVHAAAGRPLLYAGTITGA